MSSFRVFCAHNFAPGSAYLLREVDSQARTLNIEIVLAPPSAAPSAPPELVRAKLATVEGVFVVTVKDTEWISHEVGMSYALDLPIAIIAGTDRALPDGITRAISSVMRIDVNAPEAFGHAVATCLAELRIEMVARRAALPEPPPSAGSIYKISWSQFAGLVSQADRIVELDDRAGGFRPTGLLAIPPGGTVVADLLFRSHRARDLDVVQVTRGNRRAEVLIDKEHLEFAVSRQVRRLGDQVPRLLVVDDILHSGTVLNATLRALGQVTRSLQRTGARRAEVKSLALVVKTTNSPRAEPDYSVLRLADDRPVVFPYGLS